MITAGKHRARAITADLGETSTGKEQVWIEFQLGSDGGTIRWYGYCTDKAIGITTKALRACGWKGDDVTKLDGISDNEVELVVINDGDWGPKVNWINELGPGRSAAMGDVAKKSLRERVAARMKSAGLVEDGDAIPF